MATRNREHGGALLFTMILITALIAGAGILVSMQLQSTKAADTTRKEVTAQYCAEHGLSVARPALAANYAQWAPTLTACGAGPYPCAEPAWLYTAIGSHDIDGDGTDDFAVYVKDDDDEPGVNDPTVDSNLRVYIVSRCLKFPDDPQSVTELVMLSSANGTIYESQQGGFNGNGNRN